MNSSASDQFDLLETGGPEQSAGHGRRLLGILVEQERFLEFLSSEWLFPAEQGQLILGVGRASTRGESEIRTSVAVWFDIRKLPAVTLMAWNNDGWSTSLLSELRDNDEAVSWTGPLPAFAVSHYTVASSEVRAHLLAMVRGFEDMDDPSQPVEVGLIDCCHAPYAAGPSTSAMVPPRHWDALRGAAAMAAWAVPAIDPWLDLLCDTLAGDDASEEAQAVHAPWWRAGLWGFNPDCGDDFPPLWRAIISELSPPGTLREWRAKSILQAICVRAIALGDEEGRLKRVSEASLALLDDHGTIEEVGLLDDHLGLTLQLLLLRPSVENFVRWREDWPAIPPGVWWTGMTLAGYLRGFKSLPTQWRGSPSSRQLLALRTWKLAHAGRAGVWNALTMQKLDWVINGEAILLRADGKPWAEHKVGTRGIWYRADFSDPVVLDEAEILVGQARPDLLKRVLVLKDTSLHFADKGTLKVEAKKKLLTAKGQVELELAEGISVQSKLDVPRFRDWMATASVNQRIRRPSTYIRPASESARSVVGDPVGAVDVRPTTSKLQSKERGNDLVMAKKNSKVSEAPIGLAVVDEFISPEEERRLLEIIDAAHWDTSMKRKVQHYGWQYDYKLRRVDPSAYLGALPDWALDLAQRLKAQDLVDELPDQVIVNNYEGAQGISKHIDCPGCFRGAVVTISLNEAWEMVFSRKRAGYEAERYPQVLPRRSAVVLAGEARSVWSHEIPQRQREGRIARGRRVSITFRKVETNANS